MRVWYQVLGHVLLFTYYILPLLGLLGSRERKKTANGLLTDWVKYICPWFVLLCFGLYFFNTLFLAMEAIVRKDIL